MADPNEDVAPFELWLETETGDPDQPANRAHENFCNIHVTLNDGRMFALNIWTFDYLPLARYPWPYEPRGDDEPADYVLPPDLFVESLERSLIERVVSQLIANDEMKDEWLVDDSD